MNMKATGIVRRVDELGRIVIPKEIRKTINIKEGDPLEIYLDNDSGIVMKPYREEPLDFDRLKTEWDSLHKEDRQKLICEMVNHLDDPIIF